uniref:Putative secreted protein n=1 Tax=Anopheles marajoara TaxID=58244 RepID=A0A2M4CFN2_9DIPT
MPVTVVRDLILARLLRLLRILLLLLRCRLVLVDGRSEQREDDTGLRVDTDGRHHHLAAALHHVRTG